LLQLPERVTAMINNGELSMGHGRALLSLKDKSKLSAIVKKINKEKLNVRQVEFLVQQLNDPVTKREKTKVKKDVFITEYEDRLRDRFGTGVKILQGKSK